jgi:hypothetical protein
MKVYAKHICHQKLYRPAIQIDPIGQIAMPGEVVKLDP